MRKGLRRGLLGIYRIKNSSVVVITAVAVVKIAGWWRRVVVVLMDVDVVMVLVVGHPLVK